MRRPTKRANFRRNQVKILVTEYNHTHLPYVHIISEARICKSIPTYTTVIDQLLIHTN